MNNSIQVPAYDFVFEDGTWTKPTGPVAAAVEEPQGSAEQREEL